jgi:hypothetical protein
MPVLDDEGKLSGRLARFDAKQAKGAVKITHLSCTKEFLEEMILNLWLCRMALTDAMHKVRRFRRHVLDNPDSPVTSEAEKEIFEYTEMPLDTEFVQIRLNHLRSRPPMPSKYPSQP